jgi:hypothetical protein
MAHDHRKVLPVALPLEEAARLDELKAAHGVSRHALMLAALRLGVAYLAAHPEEVLAALPKIRMHKPA